MAADPQRQEASSNDLFGRWLAHHNEQQTAEQGEQTESAEGTSETGDAPRTSRRLPAAAVASSAVERDPLIGSRIAPPSTFGSRRPAANAPQKSGPGNELDREPPPGWEPIVMRSIRKKTEQAEAKQVPKPADTRSRLQRLKARLVDPVEPEPESEVETPLVPLTPPVARSVPLPVATTSALPTHTPSSSASAAPAARSLEETIRAAVPTIERPVARHAEPSDEEQPVEPAVEAQVDPQVGRRVGKHAERRMRNEKPLVERRRSEQQPPVEQPLAEEPRALEPEDVAPPTPVRAFIEATPAIAEPDPEPVAVDPEPDVQPATVIVAEPVAVEPQPYVEPEPQPVAESVVVVAEPEPLDLAEPSSVHVEHTPPAEPTEDEPARFSFLSLPKRQPKEPKPSEPRESVVVEVEPVAVAEPEPVAVAEPEPEPVAVAEPAPVIEPVAEPAPVIEPVIEQSSVVADSIEVEPEAVQAQATDAPENTEPPEAPVDQPRRSFLSLPKRQPKEPKKPEDRPRTGDAARDLVAAKARARATSPAVEPPAVQPPVQPAAVAVAVAAPPEPEVETEPKKVSKHDEVATEMPGVYKFAAKRTARRLLTIALLVGLVVSAYFVRAAVEVKDTPSIGLAAIVVFATIMVWAIRGGASVTMLEVHQGQLQVIQQGGRFIFDLASQYTRFEVHGEPGHRGWKVLFPRRGMAPFTVDASMVDPDDFMRVLRFFRPQLVTH